MRFSRDTCEGVNFIRDACECSGIMFTRRLQTSDWHNKTTGKKTIKKTGGGIDFALFCNSMVFKN